MKSSPSARLRSGLWARSQEDYPLSTERPLLYPLSGRVPRFPKRAYLASFGPPFPNPLQPHPSVPSRHLPHVLKFLTRLTLPRLHPRLREFADRASVGLSVFGSSVSLSSDWRTICILLHMFLVRFSLIYSMTGDLYVRRPRLLPVRLDPACLCLHQRNNAAAGLPHGRIPPTFHTIKLDK